MDELLLDKESDKEGFGKTVEFVRKQISIEEVVGFEDGVDWISNGFINQYNSRT